ncbi:MAG TPA: type II secretion system protein [Pirellulales bacterium]
MKVSRKPDFTLIELLVVIAIIGILDYLSSLKTFPPSIMQAAPASGGYESGTLGEFYAYGSLALLMPYMEGTTVYNTMNMRQPVYVTDGGDIRLAYYEYYHRWKREQAALHGAPVLEFL